MAEADSTGTTVTDSDDGFDLAADLEIDAREESSVADSTTVVRNAGTPDFDPNTVDIGRADPESLPAPYRKAQEWAKRRERELQGDYTRKTTEVADQRREVADLQKSLLAAQPAQQPASDPLAELKYRMGEDAPAIDVVRDIVQAVNADATAQQESHQTKIDQLTDVVTRLAQSVVANQTSGVNQQVHEAREVYGDALEQYADQIKALIHVPNPATQQQYTVKEAFELVSGKAAVKSQELQTTEERVRSDASRRTALNGAVGAADTDSGELSPSQLQAGLRQLGFE
jgi:chromosome segregation ATPase